MQIRSAQPEDHARLAELWAQTFPQLDRAAADCALPIDSHAWVGLDTGRFVAGVVATPPTDEPAARRLQVLAATDDHWAIMHAFVVAELRRRHVARWYVVVREDSDTVRRRLEAHRYGVSTVSWGAQLEITEQVLDHLRDLPGRAAPNLSTRQLSLDDARAAHELFHRNRQDFPSTPATEAANYTLEEMRALIRDHRAFGGRQQDRLVTLTVLKQHAIASAGTEFTVTDRDARGAGLATAVKAYSVWRLAEDGITRFETGGAQMNDASLRANRRLGYQVEPLWLTYAGGATDVPPRAYGTADE